MKKYKSIIIFLVFIILSNLPPLNAFFRLFFGPLKPIGLESLYVTKDLKYQYQGYLKDTLKNDCYRQYRILYPKSIPKLYRVRPIEPWKFWRWGEYLTKEVWKQPYRHVSDKELKEAKMVFYKTYDSPDGTLGCETFPSR